MITAIPSALCAAVVFRRIVFLFATFASLLLCGAALADYPAPKLDIYGDPLPAGAVARFGSMRLKHGGPCEFYPNSDKLFSWGLNEDMVRIWEVPSGKLLSTITREKSSPAGAAISADGKKMVVAWLTVVGDEMRMVFSSYDAESLELVGEVDAGATKHRMLTRPRLCNDNRWLLAGDSQLSKLAVWELATGKIVREFASYDIFDYCAANGCVVMPESPRVGSAVRVVDVKQDKELHRWPIDPRGYVVRSIALSDDGKRTAVWFEKWRVGKPDAALATDSFVEVFDSATGERVGSITEHQGSRGDVRFFPGGEEILLVGGKRAGVWNVATSRPVKYPFTPESGGYYDRRELQAISPDGRWMALTLGPTIELWDRRTWTRSLEGHAQERIQHVAVSPDSRLAATIADYHQVQLWRIEDGKPLDRHELPPLRLVETAFTPDAKHLVFLEEQDARLHASGRPMRGAPPVLRVRSLETGAVVREFDLPPDCESAFAVSPVDELAAIVSENSVVLLDLLTGKPKNVLRPGVRHKVGRPAFSPNGAYLVGETTSEVHVWDVDAGVKLYTLDGRLARSSKLAFSFTSNLLLLADRDPTDRTFILTVYELATGETVRTIAMPNASRCGEGFSPNASQVLTSTIQLPLQVPTRDDFSFTVWSIRGAQPRRSAFQLWAARWPLDATRDGEYVLTEGYHPLTVWKTPLEMRRHTSKSRAPSAVELRSNFDLLSASAVEALDAVFALADGGESTAGFIDRSLAPAKAMDAVKIKTLIDRLDSERFEDRKVAQETLLSLRPHAEPYLQSAMKQTVSAELRLRAEELLNAPRDIVRENKGEIAAIRAVQVLELIGTDSSRAILRKLADGDPAARQTVFARRSLKGFRSTQSP